MTPRKPRSIVDHTGRVFGQLTAIRRIATHAKPTRYECRCECGATMVVLGGSLVSGNTRRCPACRRKAQGEAMSKVMRQMWRKRKQQGAVK